MIVLVAVPGLALGAGLMAFAAGDATLAGRIWTAGTAPVLAALTYRSCAACGGWNSASI